MIMQSTAVFDILAQNYDADFTSSAIGRLQRNRVWSYLNPIIKEAERPLKILEINCGTGDDAIQLATMGHRVIATDSSAGMIEKAKEKIGISYGNALDVSFVVCPFSDLSTLYANEKFDLVFSNFGGLNCINKKALEKLYRDLSALTKAGGNIFFVLFAPWCLWEIFYYGIRGKFNTAFRRFKKSSGFTVNDQTMLVFYYSPRTIKKIFSPGFNSFQKHPVGLFIPPSYLEDRFKNKKTRLEKLNYREEKFSPSVLSSFADHYCVIFKKTPTNT